MNVFPRFLLAISLIALPVANDAQETGATGHNGVTDCRAERYQIQPERSDIRILVYRAGLLRGLGHNHVISSNSISGEICLGKSTETTSFAFSLPVAALLVDEREARKLEGDNFPDEVPQKDIRATRKNMLGPALLRADRYADITVISEHVAGDNAHPEVLAKVTVRDQSQVILFPVAVEMSGDTLIASGIKRVTHAELGLKPFSAAFGALKVAKEMDLKYRIVAVRQITGQ